MFNANINVKCLSINIYNLVELIYICAYSALSNVFVNSLSTGCSKNNIRFIYYWFSEINVKMGEIFCRSVADRIQRCVKYEGVQSCYLDVTII